MSQRTPPSFAELIHSAPVNTLLRTLLAMQRAGWLSEAEYAAAFAHFHRGEGVPCVSCKIEVAHVLHDGRQLCAVCALAEQEMAREVGAEAPNDE